ncbi:MAG: DUF1254 domain-containing protein [Pseudomonadota bacterium]
MIKRVLFGALIFVLVAGVIGFWTARTELPKYRDAFLYAFGPYEFVRSIQDFSGQRETNGGRFSAAAISEAAGESADGVLLNREIHNNQLADHTLRSVTTPNADTLYTSAVLELSQTPVEVVLPEVGERYLSVAFMDVFTDQFAHIGPRETGGAASVYWILGPQDTTPVPEGVETIRATGNDVWLLARIFVSGKSDLAQAQSAQNGIRVRPVFPDRTPIPFATRVTEIEDPRNFVAVVGEALARNPDHPQAARAEAFSKIKLGLDASYSPLERFFWSLVTPRAEAAISKQANEQLAAQLDWSAPPVNIGYYQDDDLLRSAISLIGFGALRREDAMYFRMIRTSAGADLRGEKSYQMTLPPDVPAQAFWSIAIYKPDETGRFFFYENPTGRHALNSGSEGLAVEADGSIVLHIGPDAPEGEIPNWLPTPDGRFAAFFRLYLPTEEAVQSGWIPPAMEKK